MAIIIVKGVGREGEEHGADRISHSKGCRDLALPLPRSYSNAVTCRPSPTPLVGARIHLGSGNDPLCPW
eukprot:scaffold726_cov262-Pinguiococcus_pyrenoidosus.AAC.22